MNNTTDSHAKLVAANDEMARQLIPAMVYLAVLMLLGIVGNLLVCFVFFRLRMSTQDRLIITLAVFDLLSCFLAMPTEIADMRYFYMFDSEFACRLLRFNVHYCAFGSILTLIVIAVDRYLKVCRPLRRQMSRKHVKISLLLILTVALIFAFPVVLVYGIRSTDIDNVPIPGHDCSTSDHVKGTVFPLVYNSVLFLLFITFLIILTVIYVRIWREMKRHRLYMARNSMPGGGSRFNFSSVSEPSSEARQDCRGRRLTLPGESSDEAVLVQSGQPGRSATGSRGQKAGRKESGASDHAPSVKSDTTLCEAEQDLSDVDDTEQQGSGNASTGTEAQAPEDAKKESQHAQSIRIDDGDARYSKVRNPETTNRKLSSEKTVPVLGDIIEEDVSTTPTTCPASGDAFFPSSYRVSNLTKENREIQNPDLKDIMSLHVTDRVQHKGIEDNADNHSDLTLTSAMLESRHTGGTDNIIQEEETTIHTTDGGGQDIGTCTCATNGGVEADSATDCVNGKAVSSGPENCSGLGDETCVSTVNRTVQQTSSDDAADSSADRGTLANPQTDVKAGQGPGNSVNSICSENTAQKRPSQTEADQTNVRDVLETVAAQTIVSQRKVTKSRSVSEVKSHKATIIAMSVTVVFFLSFVPHLSLITLRTINKQFEDNLEGAGLVLYNIFLRSYFINSVTNPFIYGVLNSRFRAECLRLFRRLLCCRKPVS